MQLAMKTRHYSALGVVLQVRVHAEASVSVRLVSQQSGRSEQSGPGNEWIGRYRVGERLNRFCRADLWVFISHSEGLVNFKSKGPRL